MSEAAKNLMKFNAFCQEYGVDHNSDDEELMEGIKSAYEEYLVENGGDANQSWDPDGSKRAAAVARLIVESKARNAREPVNDTGHNFIAEPMKLVGSPIPEEWTPNSGETARPMEVGMEVRIFGRQVFRVIRVNPTAAYLEGHGACYLFGQKSYRRTRTAEERGIDSGTYAVLDYVGRGGSNNRQGEEDMATAKVAGVPVSGSKTAAKAANSKSPKASVKAASREKKEKTVRECICGCGGQTGSAFVPGHDARFKGWLGKIAKGQGKPSDYMSSSLAQRLGPWTDKGEGKVPTKTYRDLL